MSEIVEALAGKPCPLQGGLKTVRHVDAIKRQASGRREDIVLVMPLPPGAQPVRVLLGFLTTQGDDRVRR